MSSPQSCRERSTRPRTCSSSRRCDGLGPQVALPAQRPGSQRPRANGSSSPRSQAAAGIEKPRLRAVHDLAREQRLERLAQQPLLLEPAHLVAAGSERAKPATTVSRKGTRLERPGHRRAVGLHQQVVDEVPAEVDVLEPREQLVPLGLGEARAFALERVEPAPASGQLGTRLGREDLLPALVTLERRQVRGRGEALGPVVEAARRDEDGSRSIAGRSAVATRPDALGEQVGDVGVVAAEELVAALARERHLDVLAASRETR